MWTTCPPKLPRKKIIRGQSTTTTKREKEKGGKRVVRDANKEHGSEGRLFNEPERRRATFVYPIN